MRIVCQPAQGRPGKPSPSMHLSFWSCLGMRRGFARIQIVRSSAGPAFSPKVKVVLVLTPRDERLHPKSSLSSIPGTQLLGSVRGLEGICPPTCRFGLQAIVTSHGAISDTLRLRVSAIDKVLLSAYRVTSLTRKRIPLNLSLPRQELLKAATTNALFNKVCWRLLTACWALLTSVFDTADSDLGTADSVLGPVSSFEKK